MHAHTHGIPFFLLSLGAKYSRQLSHEASSFSPLPLFSFPFFYAVPLRSPFPHLEAFLSKICALGASAILAAFALRHRTKGKNIRSKPETKSLSLRFRASLTDSARMIFRVASGFPNFPPFLVRRRSLRRFKMDLMAFSIWIFNIRSSL